MTRLSLRPRLVILVLLAVLPALALILISGLQERSQEAAFARDEADRWVRIVVHRQDDEIDSARLFLNTLAQLPEVRSDDPAACGSLLPLLLRGNPLLSNLLVLRPDGQLVCSGNAGASLPVLSQTANFQRALSERTFVVGTYAYAPSSGRVVLPVFAPVLDSNGQVVRVIHADLGLSWLGMLVDGLKLPSGSTVVIFDSRGTILDREPDPQQWVGKTLPNAPVFQEVLKEESEGMVEAAGADGVLRLYTMAPASDQAPIGAFVRIGLPSTTVYGDADQVLRRNLTLLGVVTALALLVAWFVGNEFVVQHLQPILSATRRLATGDLSARTGLRYDNGEVGQLARTFDGMAEFLQQRQTELHEAEARYRTLVEQAPAITYLAQLNEASSPIYISPQINLLGFTPSEWVANPESWVNQVYPEDRSRVMSQLAETRAAGTSFHAEYRLLTRDGRVLWIRDQAAIVRDSSGKPLYLEGILLDITDSKTADESLREALLEIRKLNAELEARVQERTGQLQAVNQNLEREVAERQQAEAKVRRLNVDLERRAHDLEVANQELEAFSYSVSHDLRMPLSSIDLFTRLVVEDFGAQLPAEGQRFLDLIHDNTIAMGRLIDDLLELSRSTRKVLQKQIIAPAETARQVVEELRPQFEGRTVEIQIGDLPPCEADPILLKQVYMNLLSNAIKFTRKREIARIEVGSVTNNAGRVTGGEAQATNDTPRSAPVTYFVRDNGVGFDMQSAERLFGVFQRFHHAEDYEGTGVGLALVARIIRRHGGQIWAEAAVDQGATFFFTF